MTRQVLVNTSEMLKKSGRNSGQLRVVIVRKTIGARSFPAIGRFYFSENFDR